MTPEALITHCYVAYIRLRAEGNSLRWTAPKGVVTDALKSRLAAHKPALLALLRDRAGRLASLRDTIPALTDEAAERLIEATEGVDGPGSDPAELWRRLGGRVREGVVNGRIGLEWLKAVARSIKAVRFG